MRLNWGIVLTKEASHAAHDFIPWYFGFSHRDYNMNTMVYYPIPFNLIVPLIHRVMYYLAVMWPRRLAQPLLRIYRLGQQDGLYMGRYNKEAVKTAAEILRAEGLEARYREEL